MSETKHTPLPWDLEIDRSTFGHLHIKRAGEPGAKAWITYFYDWRSGEEVALADAKLIVTSVNARPKVEELVGLVLKDSILGNQVGWRRPTNEEWLEIVAKAREVEAALGGKAETPDIDLEAHERDLERRAGCEDK